MSDIEIDSAAGVDNQVQKQQTGVENTTEKEITHDESNGDDTEIKTEETQEENNNAEKKNIENDKAEKTDSNESQAHVQEIQIDFDEDEDEEDGQEEQEQEQQQENDHENEMENANEETQVSDALGTVTPANEADDDNVQEEEEEEEEEEYNGIDASDTMVDDEFPLYHESVIGNLRQYVIYKKSKRIEVTNYLNKKIQDFCIDQNLQLIVGNAQFPKDEMSVALHYMERVGPFKGQEIIVQDTFDPENDIIRESMDISTYLSLKWSCIYYDIISYLFYKQGKTVLNFTLQRLKGKWTSMQKSIFNKTKTLYPEYEPKGYELDDSCFNVTGNFQIRSAIKKVALLKYKALEAYDIYKQYNNQNELLVKLNELNQEYMPENIEKHQLEASVHKKLETSPFDFQKETSVVAEDYDINESDEEENNGNLQSHDEQGSPVDEEGDEEEEEEDDEKEESQEQGNESYMQEEYTEPESRNNSSLENGNRSDMSSQTSEQSTGMVMKIKTGSKILKPAKLAPGYNITSLANQILDNPFANFSPEQVEQQNEMLIKRNELLENTIRQYELLLQLRTVQQQFHSHTEK